MTTTYTRQALHDIIQDRWESDLPDRVLEALKPFAGKPITTGLLEKLPGGKDEWRMVREFGWTVIVNRPYYSTSGSDRNGVRLVLARSEASVPLDLAYVEEDNPAYFLGRRERNHARMEVMNDREKLDQMVAVMNRIADARAELDRASKQFEDLAGYGMPFYPEYYALQDALGLKERSR